MPISKPPHSEPEILSPAAQLRLSDWQEKQEAEEVHLERLESIAKMMDAQFKLPILPIPIGLDTIVGLIPLGVPKQSLIQMAVNIFIDWLIGLVPIIGDLFDIGWQGNLRNVRIARANLEARWEQEHTLIINGE